MEATYTQTRENFARYWDRVIDEREPLRIQRRGKEDVIMIAASDFERLDATQQLLSSEANATRLLAALAESQEGHVEQIDPAKMRQQLMDGSF